MRIAIVTDAWHPQVNGVVTTLTRTVAMLNEAGHEVTVINPWMFKTVPCPTYPEIRLSLFPKAKLRKTLEEFKPDAIHIATEGTLGWAARSHCLKHGLRFSTSFHTRFPEYIKMRSAIPLAFSYAWLRRFHAPAMRTMVATESMRQQLSARGFEHLVTWSRGVDTEVFKPRGKEFLPDPRPILIYVGRVAVEKNIEEYLKLDVAGTKYVVGDGPAMQELQKKYPDVRFTGYKKGVELAQHVAAADLFVFPSRTDTFGLVMLEALACGVPVAAHPVTGPINLIESGVNGSLKEDLGEAVREALLIDGKRCRRFAEQYTWHKCTRQFFNNLVIPAAKKSHAEQLQPAPVARARG